MKSKKTEVIVTVPCMWKEWNHRKTQIKMKSNRQKTWYKYFEQNKLLVNITKICWVGTSHDILGGEELEISDGIAFGIIVSIIWTYTLCFKGKWKYRRCFGWKNVGYDRGVCLHVFKRKWKLE